MTTSEAALKIAELAGLPPTLDGWLQQWDEQGGWKATKAEIGQLVTEIRRLREAQTVVDLSRVTTVWTARLGDGRISVELEVEGLGDVALVGTLTDVLGHSASVTAGAYGVEAEGR